MSHYVNFFTDTVHSHQPSPTTSIHSLSVTTLIYNYSTLSNIQTLPAQTNIMPTRTSLALKNLPTSTIQGTKSLPSVQPSSTTRVLMVTETLQPTPQSSSRAPRPRNSKSIQPTFRSHNTASVFTPHTESSWPTAQAGSPFITLDFQTIAIIVGAAAFVVALTCVVIAILAVIIACRCRKSRKRHHVKRVESMLGNAAYGTTIQSSTSAALRTYRPGDTYDYPRFGHQLLKSVNKGIGTEVLNGAAVRPDNTYTSVTTFSPARKNDARVTSPTSSEDEDFEDYMQTNEAYAATPTSTSDFMHSMQINEVYVITPTSANGGFEQSTQQQQDDEIYENYVTNSNELDEYSYIRHVHR